MILEPRLHVNVKGVVEQGAVVQETGHDVSRPQVSKPRRGTHTHPEAAMG